MIAAISSSIGSTGLSLLGATNAAIESLARNLASELAPSFNGCEDYTDASLCAHRHQPLCAGQRLRRIGLLGMILNPGW